MEGAFAGRAEKYPVVPSDGVIRDGTGQLAFSGPTARGLRAQEDTGKQLKLVGTVRLSPDAIVYIEEQAWGRTR